MSGAALWLRLSAQHPSINNSAGATDLTGDYKHGEQATSGLHFVCIPRTAGVGGVLCENMFP